MDANQKVVQGYREQCDAIDETLRIETSEKFGGLFVKILAGQDLLFKSMVKDGKNEKGDDAILWCTLLGYKIGKKK